MAVRYFPHLSWISKGIWKQKVTGFLLIALPPFVPWTPLVGAQGSDILPLSMLRSGAAASVFLNWMLISFLAVGQVAVDDGEMASDLVSGPALILWAI
jgi:hypothetical protein